MWNFDRENHPYPSRRAVVYSQRGMVATSHPLATEAGMAILRQGGNAIDAAIAAAGAICVTDPASNGPGGDCFALVYSGGKLHGLNASGFSPKLMTLETLRAMGLEKIPFLGWPSVTVPGAPAGWAELSKRFGRLPMEQAFAPALQLAASHPLTTDTARAINMHTQAVLRQKDPIFDPWLNTYNPDRRTYGAGDVVEMHDMGETLSAIASSYARDFYRGHIAERIDRHAVETGGLIRGEDLAAYYPQWVDPISVNYKGYDVWEIPPNGQGMTALMALNILEGLPSIGHDDEFTVHSQMEAMKLAFADAARYIADPRFMDVEVEALLSKEYAAERRGLIGYRAGDPEPGTPPKGGTVYFCCADNEGNMISMIQSLYMGFGSSVLVPGTGISLQCRGANFYMDENSPNCAGPRKKPYHTIIPGFLTKDGEPIGPFGVMGGFMQPQGHVQVVMNMIDFAMNPQQALDAPRWFWMEGKKFSMESGWDGELVEALRKRGHEILITDERVYGRGQIILKLENGVLCGATEPRADGIVAGY